MNNLKKILKQVAKNNKISKSEVESEISSAILTAMESPEKSPEAELFWKDFFENNSTSTPERVISEITKRVILSLNSPGQKNKKL